MPPSSHDHTIVGEWIVPCEVGALLLRQKRSGFGDNRREG